MTGPLGVGIVGLSAARGWAARAHVPALAALDGFELRALSASTVSSAAAAGRAFGVERTFVDAGELARCDGVDLVVVAVRVPRHHELVSAAVAAGKTVLCEWPLGNGLGEAEDLARRARERGVRTAVGLQARFAPAVRYLRDLVAGGYVGEVLSSTIVASAGAWGGRIHAPADRYLVDRANGATMLTISVGHAIDGMAWVLGEPEDVAATVATRRPYARDTASRELVAVTAPDQVAVTGRLAGGAVFALHYRGGQRCGTNLRWEIAGSDGDLVVTGPTGSLQLGRFDIRGGRGRALEPLPVPRLYHRVRGLTGDAPGYVLAHAYAQLRDDLESGSAIVPDFDHAVRRHRTVEAIERAANGGERQALAA